ncbi:unnamed protein product, partial [Chrysoparadoxa australica]
EGNAFFKSADYTGAIAKYSEAIAIDPNNHAYYSNRSASYAGLLDWEKAAEDGRACIATNKSFIKGYFRLATALRNLNELDQARETLTKGLAVEPRNADLKRTLGEIDNLIR